MPSPPSASSSSSSRGLGSALRDGFNALRARAETWRAPRPRFWIDERACKSCYECDRRFGPTARKHHCRACGRVFCARCSSNALPPDRDPDGAPARVCGVCYDARAGGSGSGSGRGRGGAEEEGAAADDTAGTAGAAADAADDDSRAANAAGVSSTTRAPPPGVRAASATGAAVAETPRPPRAPTPTPAGGASSNPNQNPGGGDRDRDRDRQGPSDRARRNAVAMLSDAELWTRPPPAPRAAAEVAARRKRRGELRARRLEAFARERLEAAAAAAAAGVDVDAWAPVVTRLAMDAADAVRPSRAASSSASAASVVSNDLAANQNRQPPPAPPAASSSSSSSSSSRFPPSPYVMDPREYVKIKRIATGDPRDSRVLPRAVVFRRNVAHRRMASSRGASRIVLLAGALEYQRGESPAAPRLSSMDALLDQEHEHLRAAVARVCDLAPDVLCVERTVARFAQELLLERGVSVVLRVKTSALRRLARSTGASIAAAVDELTENAVGVCGEFRVESHAETRELGEEGEGEDAGGGGGGVKTLMTFDKCPAVGLGCSVLLKGASARELGVVKTALRDAIVWAHHAEREGAWLAAFATAAADDDDDDATSEWPPPPPQSRAVAISASSFCATRGVMCDPPNVTPDVIAHYGARDVPLGRFIRDCLDDDASAATAAASATAAGASASDNAGAGSGTSSKTSSSCVNRDCVARAETHVKTFLLHGGRVVLRVRRDVDVDVDAAHAARDEDEDEDEDGDEREAAAVWHWSRRRGRRDRAGAGASPDGFGSAFGVGVGRGAECVADDRPPTEGDGASRGDALYRRPAACVVGRVPVPNDALEMSVSRFLQLATTPGPGGGAPGLATTFTERALYFATSTAVMCLTVDAIAPLEIRRPSAVLAPAASGEKEGGGGGAAIWAAEEKEEPTAAVAACVRGEAYRARLRAARNAALAPPPAGKSPRRNGRHGSGSGASFASFDANDATTEPPTPPTPQQPTTTTTPPPASASVEKEADAAADAAAVDPTRAALLSKSKTHVRLDLPPSVATGASHAVTAYYAVQFDALRRLTLRGAGAGAGAARADSDDADANADADDDASFVESLARAAPWEGGALGGKSRAYFAKTSDDRFIVKEVSRAERNAFLDHGVGFAYFAYVESRLEDEDGVSGTCLAKILGMYQVATRSPMESTGRTGEEISRGDGGDGGGGGGGGGGDDEDKDKEAARFKETKLDFLVMENVFYGRDVAAGATRADEVPPPWRTYDLKGSLRARYAPAGGDRDKPPDAAGAGAAGGSPRVSGASTATSSASASATTPAVLLDENLMEVLATDPILVTERSKRALDAALRRDAAFLSSLGVMDYSLLAGVDRRADELVVGVVDYLRQYTWDKQLETYVKQSGLVGGGGPGKTPTVISPGQYEKRFATAMRRYFVCVPDDDDDREGN